MTERHYKTAANEWCVVVTDDRGQTFSAVDADRGVAQGKAYEARRQSIDKEAA